MDKTKHHTLVMEHSDEAVALLDEQDATIERLTRQLDEGAMFLRQCCAVWNNQGPLPVLINDFLDRIGKADSNE